MHSDHIRIGIFNQRARSRARNSGMHSLHIHTDLFARRCVARSSVHAPGRVGGCGGSAMQDRARRAGSGSDHGAEAESWTSDNHLTDLKLWSASLQNCDQRRGSTNTHTSIHCPTPPSLSPLSLIPQGQALLGHRSFNTQCDRPDPPS
jgi:hypothetical protein